MDEVRFAKLEARLERLDEEHDKDMTVLSGRLGDGAATFAKIREEHSVFRREVEEALRPKIWKVVAVVVALVGAILTTVIPLLWKLSKYPDAEKLEQFQERNDTAVGEVRAKIVEQASDLRELKGSVQRSEEKQRVIEQKLDQAIKRR